MSKNRSISYFSTTQIDTSDRALFYLIAINLTMGFIFIYLNAARFHYPSNFILNAKTTDWAALYDICCKALIPSLFFVGYGIAIRDESPKSSVFLWGIGFLPITLITSTILANGVQFTPFTPIDPLLIKMDQFMGINTPLIMTWTHNHPQIHRLLTDAYCSIILQLFFVPLLLTVFCMRKPLTVFYLAQLSTLILGTLIYYFFPTMAPSGIFHSPYFTSGQQGTSLHFYELHHHLKITTNFVDSGLIAFPSFHVIWAILLVYALRDFKVLFYPAVVWNTIVIASTIFLGWHYFTDVIGGAVLAGVGIAFGNWVYAKSASARISLYTSCTKTCDTTIDEVSEARL